MEKAEALRSIYHDHLVYIQQKVRVDYDNWKQQPVRFYFTGRSFEVAAVICHFRIRPDRPASGYLIQTTDRTVFCLYSQLETDERRHAVARGFWVLSFRIQNDDELMSWFVEDRKVLGNLSLKRITSFHGHVCPELVVGAKFCEFAQNLFNNGIIPVTGYSVIAENYTSALDAIQVLLGATLGNQRLSVIDNGKHVYTLFSHYEKRGWKVRLRSLPFDDRRLFDSLQDSISREQASLDDIVSFQRMLDDRVERLLAMSVEELFHIEEVTYETVPHESAVAYRFCSVCGDFVQVNHSIMKDEAIVCSPCFQKMALSGLGATDVH
ncbi:Formylmethanofuran dehydrogenase subunit E [Desulfofustis glycolicus DSM 9705]|uniref:Formylmethanofuran dehydrogenase subunit E n=1 Tax=Desulfofustis glycolicus DSM 9705 TaxID=1121409 RepID=A0A1M5X1K8_9BACT|nr:Formylmethanofuran dehydrogenase subunit E [Desulfofustis glycolicus DSM 9705]